jgi:hypothetical protein
MAKRSDTDEADFQDFLRQLEAPKQDVGDVARRAAAGMAPGPRMDDPNPSPPLVSPDILGRPRAQAPIYPIRQGVPTDLAPGMRTRPQTEMEGDPLAASVAGGLMGYGAGKAIPVAGAAASPFMRALQRVTTGAVEGEVASDATGGRPGTGASVGAVAGAAGAAGAGRAAREDKALFREIGRAGVGKSQEKIANIGADDIVATARDMGFREAKDWTTRAQMSGAAKQKVGAAIGDAYKPLDASAFGTRPTDQVVQALETVKTKLGQTTEGQQLMKVVTEKQEALKKLYPNGIPLSALNREIGDLESLGYSGGQVGQMSQKAAAKIPRQMAGAMEEQLQTALGAARRDPALAPSVDALGGLNKQYKATLAIDAIARRQAAREPFKKTFGEQFAAAPARTAMQVGMKAATAPVRGFGRAAEVVAGDAGAPGAGAAAGAAPPRRQITPAHVPIVESLANNNTADLSKHIESAVFGP